jgi:hypothetical protein
MIFVKIYKILIINYLVKKIELIKITQVSHPAWNFVDFFRF